MRVSLAITPLGWTDRILSFGNAGAPWYLGCGRSMSRRTDWEKFTGGRLPYSSSPGMSLAVTECHFAMVECHGGFVRFCNPRAGWDQDCSHWTVPNSASLALMHDKVSVTHPRLIHLPQADAAEVEQRAACAGAVVGNIDEHRPSFDGAVQPCAVCPRRA